MMEVKGGGIKDLPAFVSDNFGEEGYQKWFNSLSPEAQKIFDNRILPSVWLPFQYAHKEPAHKIVELFYAGNPEKAREIGLYLGTRLLSGIYKAFVQLGSPQFVLKQASSILGTFYRPAKLEVAEKGNNFAKVQFTEFAEISEVIEYNFAGFIEKILLECGCKNVKININTSLARGDQYTEYEAHWG